jgi:hypothetical protein
MNGPAQATTDAALGRFFPSRSLRSGVTDEDDDEAASGDVDSILFLPVLVLLLLLLNTPSFMPLVVVGVTGEPGTLPVLVPAAAATTGD